METKINNKEDGMLIKNKKHIPLTAILTDEERNKIPPGSYIIKDGKLIPNLKNSAMRARSKKKENK